MRIVLFALALSLGHGIPVVYMPNGTYYQPLHQATCLR